ncbi:GNAT family N-acetyltransferase [Streptomyces sp. NRRL B-1677]|uniref:GNAT family N-acetyltransferase n=1 Tax=Streptomyces klenkii TaxID=1420899 RepID=A0A3B0AX69_9ACTN|nr:MULTISPECIES: GNAT family N-acetyltransferase [Streptomyces]MBF6044047.1 GNAT family N-acetyltransferase [Streptomyces sp. NRRL B-1677]RKN65255.1 GNAT family N-acetyltransferase [Streptomyces klenkii]
MHLVIRLAKKDDIPRLRDIERAAGRQFLDIGMRAVAEDEPPAPEVLRQYIDADRAWVHTDARDVPAAYVVVDLVDGCVHIEQVSVDPGHARKRIGAGLIEHVAAWAKEHGAPALTLTTFTGVAWNGPYYERCGFRTVPEAELTPGLRGIRAEEAAHGLDQWPRTCMRRAL